MRHAVRILRTAPVLSCVVCVLLATGIAANALMYASVEALVWRPFEVEQPKRLYALRRDTPGAPVTNALYHALSDDLSPRVTLASFVAMNAPVRATGPVTEAVVAVHASRSYFEVVRPAFLMGRGFSADRGSPEVVISRALWSRAFASRAEALGATLTTHGHPLTIVGVLDGFSGTNVSYEADIFLPLDLLPMMLGVDLAEGLLEPGTRVLSVLARPVSGDIRFETIQADVRLADERLKAALGERRDTLTPPLTVVAATDVAIRHDARLSVVRLGALVALVASAVFVLACVNASALILARLERRRHALAIRLALGAGRWRLVRDGLAEVAVLAALGLGLGLLVTFAGESILNGAAVTLGGQVPLRLSVSGRVVSLAATYAMCAVLIAGVAPLWHVSRLPLVGVFGWAGSRTVAGGRLSGRRMLVGLQVAVSLGLGVLTLVAIHGLRNASSVDLGFHPDTVIRATVDLSLPSVKVEDAAAMFRTLRLEAARLPGVRSAALADAAPLSGGTARRVLSVDDETLTVQAVGAGAGYFETLGIRIMSGTMPAVGERDGLVISESLARRLQPRGVGVGSTVRIADDGPGAGDLRVVAVVPDVRHAPGESPLLTVYMPAEHETPTRRTATLLLRMERRNDLYLEQVRRVVSEVLPDVPILNLQWLSEPFLRWLMPARILATVLLVSGAVALLIALAGMYALLAYIVNGRRRELGVRMALGATPHRAYYEVASGVVTAALGGLAAGGTAGWGASRLLAHAFPGVAPADPVVLAAATSIVALLLCVGLLVPLWTVRRIVPASVMRVE